MTDNNGHTMTASEPYCRVIYLDKRIESSIFGSFRPFISLSPNMGIPPSKIKKIAKKSIFHNFLVKPLEHVQSMASF